MKEKIKRIGNDSLEWIVNQIAWIIPLSLLITVSFVVGALIKFNPWSVLVVDVVFVFTWNKLLNTTSSRPPKKIVRYVLVSTLLAIMFTIGVSFKHPQALLNFILLGFLWITATQVWNVPTQITDWKMNFEINININLDARQACFILAVRHL